MSSRCLTWIVETTASRARNRSPSSVSTPAQRSPSSTSRATGLSHSTAPPRSSTKRTSASGSAPAPPRGSVPRPPRRRPRPPLAAEDDRGRELARARQVDRDERLEGLPEQERAHVLGLELAADDVPGAHHPLALPDPALRVLGEPLVERRPQPGRRERRGAEDALDLVVVGEQPAVRVRVRAREAGDLLARAREVHPHRELAPVRERDVCERVGNEVLEAVVGLQAEL